jgi:phosphatidylglycerophosphate synthase
MDIQKISTKELRAVCQSTAPNPARESLIGRFSRFFSIYITKLFLYTSLTPNYITIIGVFVFFIGLMFFFINSFIGNLVGVCLVFFSIIIDGCDGEVARAKKNGSVAGTLYTEPVSHDIQYGLSYLILGVAFYLHTGNVWYLLLGGVASITKLLYRLLEYRFWNLRHQSITSSGLQELVAAHNQKKKLVKLFYWGNKNFFSSTAFFPILLIFTLFGHPEYFVTFYAVGYSLLWLLLFVKQIVKLNQKESL